MVNRLGSSTHRPLWRWAVLLGLIVLALFVAARVVWPSIGRQSAGFAAYYTGARLVRAGRDVAQFYDDGWFMAQLQRVPGLEQIRDIWFVNPPPMAVAFLPLTFFGVGVARAIWSLCSVLWLALAVGLLIRTLRLSFGLAACLVFVALLFQPVWANFDQAQVYTGLLLLQAIALAGFMTYHSTVQRRKTADLLTGVSLGLGFVLKTAGAGPVGMVGLDRRGWSLAGLVGTLSAVIAVSWPRTGVTAWLAYLHYLATVTDQPQRAVTAYQTLPGLILHLFAGDPQWNPQPLWNWPEAGHWLARLAILAVAGLTIYAWWRSRSAGDRHFRKCRSPGSAANRPALVFAAFAAASVIVSPVSLDYHYTVMLLPIAVLLAYEAQQLRRVADRSKLWPLVSLAVAVSLMAVDLPFRRSLALNPPVLALLAYPKLYGALLLWGLCIRRLQPIGEPGSGCTEL